MASPQYSPLYGYERMHSAHCHAHSTYILPLSYIQQGVNPTPIICRRGNALAQYAGPQRNAKGQHSITGRNERVRTPPTSRQSYKYCRHSGVFSRTTSWIFRYSRNPQSARIRLVESKKVNLPGKCESCHHAAIKEKSREERFARRARQLSDHNLGSQR